MRESLWALVAGLDYPALALAGLVFVVAALLVWALRRLQITDNTGLVILFVLPVVTYGVATGFIRKLSLPGGFGAEFREVAGQSADANQVVDERALQLVEKGTTAGIRDMQKTIRPGEPVAITLVLGRQGFYRERAIADYIRSFQTYDPGLSVVFLDEDGRFVASSKGMSVLAALEVQEFGGQLVAAIEARDLIALGRLIVLTDRFLEPGTTNAAALQAMLDSGVDHMVKLDEDRRPIGIVRQDDIMSRLIVSLTAD
jgi:hypothetical protein